MGYYTREKDIDGGWGVFPFLSVLLLLRLNTTM